MRVLYGPYICGLKAACTVELLEKMVESTPEYFEISDSDLDLHQNWQDNDVNAEHGCLNTAGKLYYLNITWENNYALEMRTDIRVIELFEMYGNKGTKNTPLFKIVDIPDYIEWEIWRNDLDMESIHQKHLIWA